MRLLLFVLSLFFASFVHANWYDSSVQAVDYGPTTSDSCSAAFTKMGATHPYSTYPWAITATYNFEYSTSNPDFAWGCRLDGKYWYDPDGSPPDTSGGDTVYNYAYTDAMCESEYGSGSTATGQIEDGSGSACTIPPDPQELANQECEAIKPLKVTIPVSRSEPLTWDYAGCRFTTTGPWLETPYGEFSALVGSAVAIEGDPETVDETVAEVEVDGGRDSTSDYVPTSDPATDCPHSNLAFGGQAYCYVGPGAPQDTDYDDGTERIDYHDGSYDVVSSDGSTTTSYNADGTVKGDTSTAPSGPGQGGSSGGWTASKATPQKFDPDGVGAEMIADAQQRLQDAVDVIQGELSGMFSGVSAGGSCQAESLSFRGTSVDLSMCDKLSAWGGAVRAAVLLLGALTAFGILMGVRD